MPNITRRTATSVNTTRTDGVEFPCGVEKCSSSVEDGICCDMCDRWYHQKCGKLSKKNFALLREIKTLKWVCPQCLQEGRTRLEKIRLSNIGSPKEEDSSCDNVTVICARNEVKTSVTSAYPTHEEYSNPAIDELWVTVGKQGKIIRELQKGASEMAQAITRLQTHSDIALGRHRNVVIKGLSEPFCQVARQRESAIRHRLMTMLRTAGIPAHINIKRILRLGKWRPPITGGSPKPGRPVLVEFANPRYRDMFLAAAGKILETTKGIIRIEPDISALRKTGNVTCKATSTPAGSRRELVATQGYSLTSPILRLDQCGTQHSAEQTAGIMLDEKVPTGTNPITPLKSFSGAVMQRNEPKNVECTRA